MLRTVTRRKQNMLLGPVGVHDACPKGIARMDVSTNKKAFLGKYIGQVCAGFASKDVRTDASTRRKGIQSRHSATVFASVAMTKRTSGTRKLGIVACAVQIRLLNTHVPEVVSATATCARETCVQRSCLCRKIFRHRPCPTDVLLVGTILNCSNLIHVNERLDAQARSGYVRVAKL